MRCCRSSPGSVRWACTDFVPGCSERGSALLAGIVGLTLVLHAAFGVGIAATIASGDVALDVASRLDVKQEDATPAPAEPWLPAHAVDASGALLCRQRGPIVLHGAYAYLEHVYLGLDHRLRCGILDVRLAGIEPATGAPPGRNRPARMARAGLDAADPRSAGSE